MIIKQNKNKTATSWQRKERRGKGINATLGNMEKTSKVDKII